METILITGPIGSGKSVVSKYLEKKSYPVFDCDSRCKSLYENVPGLKERIESELGIPFSELRVVFSDKVLRERLEAIVYPLLIEDFKAWKSDCKSPLCFVESAIACQKPQFDGLYDRIWLVNAPLEIRKTRNAMAGQRDPLQDFCKVNADVRIENSSSKEDLYKEIDKILKV